MILIINLKLKSEKIVCLAFDFEIFYKKHIKNKIFYNYIKIKNISLGAPLSFHAT